MTEERTERKRRGIGQILWPLLLACVLLALWLSYWQSFNPLNWGSNAEVEMTPVSEDVTVSDAGDSDSTDGSDAASDDSSDDAASDADATSADSDGADASDSAADSDSTQADATDQSEEEPAAANAAADADADVNATDAASDSDDGSADSGSADDDASDASGADTSDSGADDSGADDSGADSGGDDGSSDGNSSDDAAASFGIGLNSILTVSAAAFDTAESGLRLYATAALDAPTREVYSPGDQFVLIEPGEDFDAYPVEVDGISWVRVRDGDGLLGWADLSLLVSE